MKAVFFAAGLGDFIRVCYKTDSYSLLSETREMVTVVLALHNPYASECFAHHPNRQFIRVVDLPGQFEHLRSSGMRGAELHHALMRVAGVEPVDIVSRNVASQPEFFATDEVASEAHIIIQPFASGAGRTIPETLLISIVRECARTGRPVHIVSRSYCKRDEKGKLTHGAENLPPQVARNPSVVWHRNLSVPATINLVKNSALFVGSHSAMLQAAWFENKPAHVLYPKGQTEWAPDRIGTGYTFGANFDNTVHQDFKDFRIERLIEQLNSLREIPNSGTHIFAGGRKRPFLRERASFP